MKYYIGFEEMVITSRGNSVASLILMKHNNLSSEK